MILNFHADPRVPWYWLKRLKQASKLAFRNKHRPMTDIYADMYQQIDETDLRRYALAYVPHMKYSEGTKAWFDWTVADTDDDGRVLLDGVPLSWHVFERVWLRYGTGQLSYSDVLEAHHMLLGKRFKTTHEQLRDGQDALGVWVEFEASELQYFWTSVAHYIEPELSSGYVLRGYIPIADGIGTTFLPPGYRNTPQDDYWDSGRYEPMEVAGHLVHYSDFEHLPLEDWVQLHRRSPIVRTLDTDDALLAGETK